MTAKEFSVTSFSLLAVILAFVLGCEAQSSELEVSESTDTGSEIPCDEQANLNFESCESQCPSDDDGLCGYLLCHSECRYDYYGSLYTCDPSGDDCLELQYYDHFVCVGSVIESCELENCDLWCASCRFDYSCE